MFKKVNKTLDERYALAKLLKEKFPQGRFKLRKKMNTIEVYYLMPVDNHLIREIEYLVFINFKKRIKILPKKS